MKKCKVKDCEKKHWARGYCKTHISMLYRRGEIPEETRLDPNDIIVEEDIALIVMRDTMGKETGRAMIDKSDIDVAKKHKWYLNNSGYAITRVNHKEQILLHRLIMNLPPSKQIDHVNRNTLDNRQDNLRICTQEQNTYNTKVRSDSTTGVTGVDFDKRRNKWRARINFKKKSIHLGYFDEFKYAVLARHEAEKEYYGEFRSYDVDKQVEKLFKSKTKR